MNRQKVKERKLAESGKSTHGGAMHSYTPEEFGITAEQLSSGGYKGYVDKFNVPMSAN